MRRNLTLYVCLNAAMLAALAAARHKQPSPHMTVRLYNDAEAPAAILADAEKQAARLFLSAGIELSFAPCPASDREFQGAPAKFAACVREWDAPMVVIKSQPDANSFTALHGSAGGAAKDGRITIPYERVKSMSEAHSTSLPKLLGYILTHELGHVLLGDNHSQYGIMVATYRQQELRHVETGDLFFTKQQAERMRSKLSERELLAGASNRAK
jgi:hypothetical protein